MDMQMQSSNREPVVILRTDVAVQGASITQTMKTKNTYEFPDFGPKKSPIFDSKII